MWPTWRDSESQRTERTFEFEWGLSDDSLVVPVVAPVATDWPSFRHGLVARRSFVSIVDEDTDPSRWTVNSWTKSLLLVVVVAVDGVEWH